MLHTIMSRQRNRNIRTKIQAVTKWGQNYAATSTNISPQLNRMVASTADSGIAEVAPKLELHESRQTQRLYGWDSEVPEREEDLNYYRRSRYNAGIQNDEDGSSDNESNKSSSSVNTLKVLDEIRNLEDSVKTNSADSYNSWTEEYESNATQLVQAEYERMERVLQCREAIPSHYDKDEYKLWIKTFPFLSLTSHSPSGPLQNSSPIIVSSTPKYCDTTHQTPTILPASKLHSLDKIIDNFYPYTNIEPSRMPTHTTTTYTNKDLAINNTINPRTLVKMDHSFLQLAPLNIAKRRQSLKHSSSTKRNFTNQPKTSASSHNGEMARTAEWLKDVQSMNKMQQAGNNKDYYYSPSRTYYEKSVRRKSSRTVPLKSSSEFIVLPPIEGKELRSASAATIASLSKVPVLPNGRLKHPVYPLYESEKETEHHEKFVSYRHRKRKYQ